MATEPTLGYQGRHPALEAASAPRVRLAVWLITLQAFIIALQVIEIWRFDQHIYRYMPTMAHAVYGSSEAWCFENLVVFGAALAQLCLMLTQLGLTAMAASSRRVLRHSVVKGLMLLVLPILLTLGSWWLCLVGFGNCVAAYD